MDKFIVKYKMQFQNNIQDLMRDAKLIPPGNFNASSVETDNFFLNYR